MVVEEVAARAIEFLNKDVSPYIIGYRERLALIGYFQGVISGTIQLGQSLVGEMLLNSRAPWEFMTDCNKHVFDKDGEQLLKDVFASGMCVEGQPLAGIAVRKESNWVERS